MPRALWWPQGGGLFLMGEVPLYTLNPKPQRRGLSHSTKGGRRWRIQQPSLRQSLKPTLPPWYYPRTTPDPLPRQIPATPHLWTPPPHTSSYPLTTPHPWIPSPRQNYPLEAHTAAMVRPYHASSLQYAAVNPKPRNHEPWP